MGRQIVIEFDFGPGKQPDIHPVRNFNDSLYHMSRSDDWISFSIDQIDKLTGQRVGVKSARKWRRVLLTVKTLINDHGFAGIARTSVPIQSN
jgi:hypothetical protein